jgi:hypothetical protein
MDGKSNLTIPMDFVQDDEEKLPKIITVSKTQSIHQVIQDVLKIPPASIRSITFYGKILDPAILIQHLPVTDWDPAPLMINHVHDGSSPLQQEILEKCLLYYRIINETISRYWETFSHSTCGMMGYAASILQVKSPGIQMTRDMAEQWVINAIQEKKSMDDLIEAFFRWDMAARDCVTSHVVLMKTLKANQDLSDVRWRIYQGGGHGLLFGVLFDGSLLLIDVGTLRECVQFAGDGIINYVLLLGKR